MNMAINLYYDLKGKEGFGIFIIIFKGLSKNKCDLGE